MVARKQVRIESDDDSSYKRDSDFDESYLSNKKGVEELDLEYSGGGSGNSF